MGNYRFVVVCCTCAWGCWFCWICCRLLVGVLLLQVWFAGFCLILFLEFTWCWRFCVVAFIGGTTGFCVALCYYV